MLQKARWELNGAQKTDFTISDLKWGSYLICKVAKGVTVVVLDETTTTSSSHRTIKTNKFDLFYIVF